MALDDNGVWQNSSGSGAFSSSGSDNWSLSGSGDFSDEPYLNSASAASGTTSVSGSGNDSYQYTQNYNFLPTGQWQGVSGSGSTSGTGSVTTGYSASGDYSGAYGAWDTDEYNGAGIEPNRSDLGQTGGPGIYAGIYGTDWSGSVSSSGSVTQSFGYSTTSNYTSADGWTSSGSASAENTGNTSASYSGSSPLSAIFNPGGSESGTMSGSASASGSDWSSYDYTQNSTLGTDGWWNAPSGSGSASGGASGSFTLFGRHSSYTDDQGFGTGSLRRWPSMSESGGRNLQPKLQHLRHALRRSADRLVAKRQRQQETDTATFQYGYSRLRQRHRQVNPARAMHSTLTSRAPAPVRRPTPIVERQLLFRSDDN